MQAGTIFFLSLCPDLFPSLYQHARTSAVFIGMVHVIPLKLMKYFHSFSITLQCKKRWFIVRIKFTKINIWSISPFPFSLSYPEQNRLPRNKPCEVSHLMWYLPFPDHLPMPQLLGFKLKYLVICRLISP